MKSRMFDWVCLTLIIIGAINWGLIGFFNFDLVSTVFNGGLHWIARVIFGLVGLAGIYSLCMYSHLEAKDV